MVTKALTMFRLIVMLGLIIVSAVIEFKVTVWQVKVVGVMLLMFGTLALIIAGVALLIAMVKWLWLRDGRSIMDHLKDLK